MNSIQKPLEQKNWNELNKQTSQNLDKKKINQTDSKNRKSEEKVCHKIKKKSLHIDNYCDFAISHEMIRIQSIHYLKF